MAHIWVDILLFPTSAFNFWFLFFIVEKEKISQMQEHYERLLQKAKDELEVLRERVEVTHQNLMITQNWYVWKIEA